MSRRVHLAGTKGKISLVRQVSLGTGAMIGTGVFAFDGKVSGVAGDWLSLALVIGALITGVSAYSCTR
jgi:amino acid transporter